MIIGVGLSGKGESVCGVVLAFSRGDVIVGDKWVATTDWSVGLIAGAHAAIRTSIRVSIER